MAITCPVCGSDNVTYDQEYSSPGDSWGDYAWYKCQICGDDFVYRKPSAEKKDEP